MKELQIERSCNEQFNNIHRLRIADGPASMLALRMSANLGVSGSTPLLERFSNPVKASTGDSDPTAGRWLEGLYLTSPTEWEDPYRFFRW